MSPTVTRPRQREQAGVSDATISLDLRRTRTRRGFVLTIIAPLLVLALIAAGIWVLGFSAALAARSVQVHGTAVLDRAQVLQAAQVPLGVPLARIDTVQVTARVLSLREVESAEVDRSWPHTVVITIRERQPAFAVAEQASYLLVDAHGVAYRAVDTRPSDQVLAVVDPGNQQLLTQVAAVVAVLPADVRSELKAVRARTRDSITLQLSGGRSVLWGDDSRPQDKLRVLQALLKTKASSYDVSAPDQPATRR